MNTRAGILILTICCTFWIPAMAGETAPLPNLKQVVLIHRHGIREPSVVVSQNPPKLNAEGSDLTSEGVRMMMTLGHTIRARYDSFIPARYSIDVIQARSTALDRTRQSANAVLRGLFPNPLDFFSIPAVPSGSDAVLHYDWPTLDLTATYKDPGNALAKKEAQRLFNASTIQRLGQILGLEVLCSLDILTCVRAAQDHASSFFANGVPCDPFLCVTMMPQLKYIRGILFQAETAYLLDQVEYEKAVGLRANLLMTDIASGLTSSYVFREFSAHDSTLVGVYATLNSLKRGDFESPLNVPRYGDAVIMEFTTDGNLQVLFATPDQTYGSNHSYTITPLQITCMSSATGTPYDAPSGRCSVSEWTAYQVTVQAKHPDGVCVINVNSSNAVQCATTYNTVPSDSCVTFRQLCPKQACGNTVKGLHTEAAYLDYTSPSLVCRTLNASGSSASGKLGAIDIIVIVFFAIAVVVALVWLGCRFRKQFVVTRKSLLLDETELL